MEDEVDALGDVSPEEFVTARDALAKRLKAEGEADTAAEVKRLRRPTVAQWIAEQVRRHHDDAVDALRKASTAVAEAQEAAITKGDRDSLREATAKRRDALEALGQVVHQVLARNGRPAQHRDEVLNAIESAVTAAVTSGTFGLRDDIELPERPKRKPARDVEAERRAAEAKAAVKAAEARVRRAQDELEKAEAELEAALERSERLSSDASRVDG